MQSTVFSFQKVYGAVRPVYFFFVGLLILCFNHSAAGGEKYLDVLLRSAQEKKLSGHRYWNVLMHYKPWRSGRKSLIDDPRFFLHAEGQMNPEAELEATVKSFFREEQAGEEHPRCRFVARYGWLREELNIDESLLPPVQCKEFQEAFERVQPHSAVLVFPTTLNNSPSSMFGHTLIRIDSQNRNQLLSYAVTYAAEATDTNGFLYAFKGMFGYYPGYFTVLPYYEKVAEYSNIERRDIWEYELNLTPEEVRRMVLHIWEVRDIYADYYFFDENCSFDLLLLLEAGRPSLRLSDVFWEDSLRFWVIPLETIRLIQEQGLVADERYRPSHAKRILAVSDGMTATDKMLALEVAGRKRSPETIIAMTIEPQAKTRILDLSAELLQYQYARKEIAKEEYLKQFLPVLRARSSLGKQSDDAYPVSRPTEPERGHLPGKMSLGAGYRTDSWYTELGWRAAYHDLLDSDEGFTDGSQINFFDISGRYYFEENSFRLQQFYLIDIFSLSPRNMFFAPVSWKVNTGFDRKVLSDGKEHLVYRVNGGGGVAYQLNASGIVYFIVESDLNSSGYFQDNFSLGFGASAGILQKLTDGWKINLSAKSLFYDLGDEHDSFKASIVQSFRINTNNNIILSLSRERTFDIYKTEGMLSWRLYIQ